MSTTVSPPTYSALTPGTARPTPLQPPTATGQRVVAMDIVRGVVMVLMAIDHVRVFAGVPAGGPTFGLFFTRWITNFCAPAFVFFAGTSAYLHGRKLGDRGTLARFLVVRGAWLVLLELTVLRVAWTFNVDYAHYLLAGVIWAIGWCMIVLGALVFLPTAAVGAFGVAVIALHNLTDFAPQAMERLGSGGLAWLWQLLYLGGSIPLGGRDAGPRLAVLYVLVPWIGVMAAGYAFGAVMTRDAVERRRTSLRLGTAATVAFLLLRVADVYGNPGHWRTPPSRPAPSARASAAPPSAASPGAVSPSTAPAGTARPNATPPRRPPAALRFLNTNKYPASLLFLLMTLGPTLILLALVDGARGAVARVLATFGRVPLFYYLLHIPLIHLLAVVVSTARTGAPVPWLFANHPMAAGPPPDGYTWSLLGLYAGWALVVGLLYWPCRWFARVRAERGGWLTYL